MGTGQLEGFKNPGWSIWLDRAVWLALAFLFLYRCVLPMGSEPLSARMTTLRVKTDGRPAMVVFDGSR
ncbi:MAG: hypothetical protein VKN33_10090 [Candidatus Sericytochromatia bacterium]|nr:hypothetical protein [Candidatus Sericytochromatia bacterium]